MTAKTLRLVVFDLDYTVWQPEMYQLWGEPKLTEPSKKISEKVLREAKTTKEGNDDNQMDTVTLKCQDGSIFVFPKQDCAMLPIVHATTEELAIYLWSRILEGLNSEYLLQRGIHTLEVTVAEAIGQEALFRLPITANNLSGPLDVKRFILEGEIKACPSRPKQKTKMDDCGGKCESCLKAFSDKLQRLADAINNKDLPSSGLEITVKDLEAAIGDL